MFVVSWFNPGEAQGDWGLETYVLALERAMGVTREVADASQMGGTRQRHDGLGAEQVARQLEGTKPGQLRRPGQ